MSRPLNYDGSLKPHAQELRRNMTRQERHLWYDFLKRLPVTVHRQKTLGTYIVDFYIASAKVVIELDGSQHYEKPHQARDEQRDAYMESIGCKVLRYSNADVNYRFEGVCEDILFHISLDTTTSP